MQAFTRLEAVAIPIDEANVDTNQLCPTRFNKLAQGPDYTPVLFHDRRFDKDGNEVADFILNRAPYRDGQIIVADRNFGCGSSRESAVYALEAFGIRCVVAPSFGDIFMANCFKNGVLALELDAATAAGLRRQLTAAPGARLAVNLDSQRLTAPDGAVHTFHVHPLRRRSLLEGLDDIALTRRYADRIAEFERDYWGARPFLDREIDLERAR